MRISSIKVQNKQQGTEIDEITFINSLTLLVGASGVGKTQILKSINNIKNITRGDSIGGFYWKIIFIDDTKKNYIWEGEFEKINTQSIFPYESFFSNEKTKVLPTIIYEKLIIEEEVVIERNEKITKFEGSVTPKLSSNQSIIYTLKEEPLVSNVYNAFSRIKFKDNTERELGFEFLPEVDSKRINLLKTYNDIKNSNEGIKIKFFLSYKQKLDVFEEIKYRFIEVFPQVEDVKFEILKEENVSIASRYTIPIMFIKERDVDNWIDESKISSGMARTIIHIAEMLLSNDGTVFLIDEFENSLGINCIDVLTDDLIHENNDLQFIVTSHHPYIINNIPYEYWKIVHRKGGKVSTNNALDYKMGRSKQDAFVQLVKLIDKNR